MKRGAAASSPRATRSSRITRDSAASVTTLPAQTVSNSSGLVTRRRPGQQPASSGERLACHRHGLAVAQESVLGDVDLERSESPSLNVGHEPND
jgi:hypothetical protein